MNASIEAVEFSEVVRRRRMVRHYSSRPLAPEVIERVLANALRAPSAGFAQGWAFLALTNPADRARFWPFVPDWVDTGMAALLMLLTAVDEELGACFFGIMPENIDPFRTEFGVPGDCHPIGAVTVGYRADDLPPQGSRLKENRRDAVEVYTGGNGASTARVHGGDCDEGARSGAC